MNIPLPLNSRIGIIGGGQLGRMLALDAAKLGYRTCIFSDVQSCASDVTNQSIIASYTDPEAISLFARSTDVATIEFENIPTETLLLLEKLGRPVFPGRIALETSQDRRREKVMASALRIPTPKYWVIESESDFSQKFIFPALLKTARDGYDGKGQRPVSDLASLTLAWKELGSVPCVLEEKIKFKLEFSIILARNERGESKTFPLFQNSHENQILSRTDWPLRGMDDALQQKAKEYANKIATHLNVVGLLAVEFFLTADNEIVFNEIAPRPHNSGHITQYCSFTSQFTAHIKAITGHEIGNLDARTSGRMVNIIGDFSVAEQALGLANTDIHLYGKDPRPGRKLGHVIYDYGPEGLKAKA